jgi:hypothetical protein
MAVSLFLERSRRLPRAELKLGADGLIADHHTM